MKKALAAVFALVALTLVSVSCTSRERAAAPEPPNRAHALVERGATLLDVRTPEEYSAGHLPGAVNIPVQELDRRLAELPDHGHPIVVYCQSGRRSHAASEILEGAGYSSVYDLGPMSAW